MNAACNTHVAYKLFHRFFLELLDKSGIENRMIRVIVII